MSNEMLKVEGEEGLFRDPSSKAIINKNKKAWINHKLRRKSEREKNEKIQSLENDVAELKELVKQLIDSKPKKRTTKSTEE